MTFVHQMDLAKANRKLAFLFPVIIPLNRYIEKHCTFRTLSMTHIYQGKINNFELFPGFFFHVFSNNLLICVKIKIASINLECHLINSASPH